MKVFIDIETLPTQSNEVIDHVVSKIKAPSNYKDPKKIQAYIDGQRNEAVAKTGLSGLHGQVYMIGIAVEDDEPFVIREETEVETITKFNRFLDRTNQPQRKHIFIGHNALGFDIPFLSQRLMVNGFAPLFRHYTKPWDMSVEDTMTMFACGTKSMYSLKDLCLAFGVPSANKDCDIEGSKMLEYYLAGRHAEVEKYCMADVTDCRNIYRQMTGG